MTIENEYALLIKRYIKYVNIYIPEAIEILVRLIFEIDQLEEFKLFYLQKIYDLIVENK